jgi:hypothetical protein
LVDASPARKAVKVTFAAVIVVCMLPNLSAEAWVSPAKVPVFFKEFNYRHYLSRGETVFILPFGPRGDSLLWQAETGMYFRMAEGAGPPPGEFVFWPIVDAFWRQAYTPRPAEQFRAFLAAHGVSAVIAADDNVVLWQRILSGLGVEPVAVGGVHLYRLPPWPAAEKRLTAVDMSTRANTERFETLVDRVEKFIRDGGNPNILTVAKARQLNIVPTDSLIGPYEAYSWLRDPQANWFRDPNYDYSIWLIPEPDGRFVIGEHAWYPAVRALMEKYRVTGAEILFVLQSWAQGATRTDTLGELMMVFKPDQLVQAAVLARASLSADAATHGGVAKQHNDAQ